MKYEKGEILGMSGVSPFRNTYIAILIYQSVKVQNIILHLI